MSTFEDDFGRLDSGTQENLAVLMWACRDIERLRDLGLVDGGRPLSDKGRLQSMPYVEGYRVRGLCLLVAAGEMSAETGEDMYFLMEEYLGPEQSR